MKQLFYVGILLLLVFDTHCDEDDSAKWFNSVVTLTPSGVIQGVRNKTRLGRKIETYRGIRYAEPPVGELRFKPPKLIQKYYDLVDATKDGPACPQAVTTIPMNLMDEDCLRINVYTPLKKERTNLLPVIVFMHQSSFYNKASRSDIFGPDYLLDRDIVLVTFNYRLGSLGFISTGDEIAPGNNGLKDQVIALRWIQRNIASFGGNPDSVTLTGYSSGSTSIVLHLVSPMSKGLFHQAISMSGSPTRPGKTPTDQYEYALKQAQLLKCPTENSTAIIKCLKTKSWQDISKTYKDFFIFARNPVHLWDPVIENDFGQERFLTMDPTDAIKDGKIHNVPYIIGQNEAEFFTLATPILTNDTLLKQINENWDETAPIAFLLPEENRTAALVELRSAYLQNRPLKDDEESNERLGNLYGDSVVAFSVNRLANLMCRYSTEPTWYFYFTYVGNYSFYNDPLTAKPNRAVHQDETLYLFYQSYFSPRIGTTGGDALTVDRMTALFYNFARYGDPNPQEDTPELNGLVWPAMKPDNRTYLRISNDLTLHQNLKDQRLQIWEQLYPVE